MPATMRLLLLLSAFLTALTGVVASGVAAEQPVQTAASASPVRAHAAIVAAAPRHTQAQAFAASTAWYVAAPAIVAADRATFGARRRE